MPGVKSIANKSDQPGKSSGKEFVVGSQGHTRKASESLLDIHGASGQVEKSARGSKKSK